MLAHRICTDLEVSDMKVGIINPPGNPRYYLELRIVFPASEYKTNAKSFHILYQTFDSKRAR
jgi:hypothetical protein